MNLRKRVRVLVSLTAFAVPMNFLNGAERGSQSQAAPASPMAFDVASIKLTKPGVRGYSILPANGRLTTSNTTLKMLVAAAYHVYDFQVSGGPKWFDSERYDIEGKAAGETSPTKAQLMGMLQKLLADRFSLEFHRETRTLPVYVLELAKGGHKLTPSKDTGENPYFRLSQRRQITAQRAPLAFLVETLSPLLDRPVLDKTGLTGIYDFKLEWTPDEVQVRSSDTAPPADENVPSLSAAIQEQLGLKLLSQKGPVEILVIDRAEKASGN